MKDHGQGQECEAWETRHDALVQCASQLHTTSRFKEDESPEEARRGFARDLQCFAASIAISHAIPYAKRRSPEMTDVQIDSSVSSKKMEKFWKRSETTRRKLECVDLKSSESWRSSRRPGGRQRPSRFPTHLRSLQWMVGWLGYRIHSGPGQGVRLRQAQSRSAVRGGLTGVPR